MGRELYGWVLSNWDGTTDLQLVTFYVAHMLSVGRLVILTSWLKSAWNEWN